MAPIYRYKLFYGMSSKTAMEKHRGGVADYRASEGKTIRIPYRGDVEVELISLENILVFLMAFHFR